MSVARNSCTIGKRSMMVMGTADIAYWLTCYIHVNHRVPTHAAVMSRTGTSRSNSYKWIVWARDKLTAEQLAKRGENR